MKITKINNTPIKGISLKNILLKDGKIIIKK
mgnify:CR=1 FL=1